MNLIIFRHHHNTYKDFTYKDFTYKDFTYKVFTYKDFTHKDFSYNINKCDITYNGLYLILILLINDFTNNSK
jgi:hypothetical protein